MTLQERFKEFKKYGMPMTKIAKEVGLSTQALYAWLHDTLRLSEKSLTRIDNYLQTFGF